MGIFAKKIGEGEDAQLICAPRRVLCNDYELLVENKDDYDLPLDGWDYYESEEVAYQTLGVKTPEEVEAEEGAEREKEREEHLKKVEKQRNKLAKKKTTKKKSKKKSKKTE